jgi:hypothetical protein
MPGAGGRGFSPTTTPRPSHLEAQGIEYNKQRLESNAARRAKINAIRESLRGATDEQINAALAALGLN